MNLSRPAATHTVIRRPGTKLQHNQTLVRAPFGTTVNHNQTVVRRPGTKLQHNQTLVRR